MVTGGGAVVEPFPPCTLTDCFPQLQMGFVPESSSRLLRHDLVVSQLPESPTLLQVTPINSLLCQAGRESLLQLLCALSFISPSKVTKHVGKQDVGQWDGSAGTGAWDQAW